MDLEAGKQRKWILGFVSLFYKKYMNFYLLCFFLLEKYFYFLKVHYFFKLSLHIE